MRKTTLRVTYLKTQIDIMNDTLSYLSERLSTKVIDNTQFIIRYNPHGGYYNLFIQCKSKTDALTIKDIHEEFIKEHIFKA